MASHTAMLKELAAARQQRTGQRKPSSSSNDDSQSSSSSVSHKSASSSGASSTSSKSSDYDKQELRTEITPTSATSKRTMQRKYDCGDAARLLSKRLTSSATRDGNVFRHTTSMTDGKTGNKAHVNRTLWTHDGGARKPEAYQQNKVLTNELGENQASAFAQGLGLIDKSARYKVYSDARCKRGASGLDLYTGSEGFRQGIEKMTEQISGGVVSKGPVNLRLAANTFNPDLTSLPRPPRPPGGPPFDNIPPPPPPPSSHPNFVGSEMPYPGSFFPPPPPPAVPRDWFTPFISPVSRKGSDDSTIDEHETVTVHKDGQISREATKHKRYRKTASGVSPRIEMLVQSLEGPDREYHKDSLWRKKNGEVHRMTSATIPKWGRRPDLFKIVQRHAGFPDESRVSAKITATRRKSWTKEQVKRHNAYPKALPYLARRFGMKVDDQTALDIDYEYERSYY